MTILIWLTALAYTLIGAYTTYCVLMRNAAPTGHISDDYYEREGNALLFPFSVLAGIVWPAVWFVWSVQNDNDTDSAHTLASCLAGFFISVVLAVALPDHDWPVTAMHSTAVLSGLTIISYTLSKP